MSSFEHAIADARGEAIGGLLGVWFGLPVFGRDVESDHFERIDWLWRGVESRTDSSEVV